MVKFLLSNGANVGDSGNDGWCPLHWACYCGRDAIVSLLVDRKDSTLNRTSRSNRTAIYIAAECGRAKVVDALLKKRPNLAIQETYYG